MKSIFLLALAILAFACREKKAAAPLVVAPQKVETPRTDSLDAATVAAVLTALKTKNWEALIALVHPEEGLRFSPYATVDLKNDLKFSPQALRESLPPSNKSKMKWGRFDATGEEIRLDFAAYLAKFVYDLDFLNAPKQSINRRLSSGNSIDNIKTAYPNYPFSESFFDGIDPKYGGMDWRALRLVFKKKDEKWLLVGIVHDQWTS